MSEKNSRQAAVALGLQPMRQLDITVPQTTSELLQQMASTAFTGRTLGEAADVLETMLKDPDCLVVLTLSGAMTMAGLGGLVRASVDRGWVQCIISTGALVGHGVVENLGLPHFKADLSIPDEVYYENRLNRVYDTLEPEQNLDEMELIVRDIFYKLAQQQKGAPVGTGELLAFMGTELPGEGILQSAAREGALVIIPALSDSELGLDLAVHQAYCRSRGLEFLRYDPLLDLERFRVFCQTAVRKGQRLGIITIGGGVPRNWAQQVGPYVEVRSKRLGEERPDVVRYTYGLRICPDPVHYGHLSGCTYSEGVTWGKFVPRAEGGRWSEVLLDATVGWPILARAMIDRGL